MKCRMQQRVHSNNCTPAGFASSLGTGLPSFVHSAESAALHVPSAEQTLPPPTGKQMY